MAITVVIAYDISNDNHRARIAALLASWGERVQKSVFECTLPADELDNLLKRIDDTINHHRDTVTTWRQCATCFPERTTIGVTHEPTDDRYWII